MTVPAVIKELEKIEMTRQTDNVYRLDHAVTAKQKKILQAFGMNVIRIPVGHPGVHADLLLYFGSIPPRAAVFVTSKSKSSNFAIFLSPYRFNYLVSTHLKNPVSQLDVHKDLLVILGVLLLCGFTVFVTSKLKSSNIPIWCLLSS